MRTAVVLFLVFLCSCSGNEMQSNAVALPTVDSAVTTISDSTPATAYLDSSVSASGGEVALDSAAPTITANDTAQKNKP